MMGLIGTGLIWAIAVFTFFPSALDGVVKFLLLVPPMAALGGIVRKRWDKWPAQKQAKLNQFMDRIGGPIILAVLAIFIGLTILAAKRFRGELAGT